MEIPETELNATKRAVWNAGRAVGAKRALAIPTSVGNLNAICYKAAGPGPHATALLLHGMPGNEQNLDLAQSMRRAG